MHKSNVTSANLVPNRFLTQLVYDTKSTYFRHQCVKARAPNRKLDSTDKKNKNLRNQPLKEDGFRYVLNNLATIWPNRRTLILSCVAKWILQLRDRCFRGWWFLVFSLWMRLLLYIAAFEQANSVAAAGFQGKCQQTQTCNKYDNWREDNLSIMHLPMQMDAWLRNVIFNSLIQRMHY